MRMDPKIRYAKSADGTSIAYWAIGEGRPLVYMPAMPWSHIEREWALPEWRRRYERLATGRRADGFPTGGTYTGPDAVLNGVFVPLVTDWDGFSVTPDEVVVSGEHVVSFGHYTGANKKTGKSFRVPFAHAWRLKDGKITHFQQYTDTHLVQEAMK